MDKDHLAAAPKQQGGEELPEPVAWLVCSVNGDGSLMVEHSTAWEQAAHDHINGARGHNAIANLRDVTQAENNQNERHARKTNKAVVLGASTSKQTKKFRSRIVADGGVVHLGYFDTPEQAHAVYVAAKRRLHRGATL